MSSYPIEIPEDAVPSGEAMLRMNRMYRWQRHIYDATRRYYLLGRDRMIADIGAVAGSKVLEIGCGTGRNLVQTARRYPHAQLFGVDVSTEMLTSACATIARAGLGSRIRLAQADATIANPRVQFGVPSFDHVMISYTLSMIPDWQRVLAAAIGQLGPGGRLHVVDFGNCERVPDVAGRLLLRWLALFEVTPRDQLEQELSAMADVAGAGLKFERPFRGYAQHGVLTLAKGSGKL